MYCILVAGKSTMAEVMSERLKLPVISKDSIKELSFDNVGFRSRAEKVNLGILPAWKSCIMPQVSL